jgi:hypothetical protein
MKKRVRIIVSTIAASIPITAVGCGTITHGSQQSVSVSSSPPGAYFSVDGTGRYTTPTKVKMKRKEDHVLTFTMDGYQSEQAIVSSVVTPALAGNILFGGIIGGAVDLASGGAFRLEPGAITVTMRPLGSGESASLSAPVKLTPETRLRNIDKLLQNGVISQQEHDAMRKLIMKDLTDSMAR